MYDGIFLDIDDTIFDYEVCSKNALKQACFQCDVPYSDHLVSLFRKIDEDLWKKQKQGLLSIKEVLKLRAEQLLVQFDKLEKSKEFEDCFKNGLSTEIVLVAGADEIIKYLSDLVPLYAASNGMKKMQLNRLNKAELLHYFTDIYVSDDIGSEKPNVLFFHECMERSKLVPSQILMVGDSLEADMIGAYHAGIDTCWYNPKQKQNNTSIKLKHEIIDLKELKGIILM